MARVLLHSSSSGSKSGKGGRIPDRSMTIGSGASSQSRAIRSTWSQGKEASAGREDERMRSHLSVH